MKLIPLSRGFTAIVDDADHERVAAYRWTFDDGYAVRYVYARGEPTRKVYLHRFVAGLDDAPFIDHRNRDTLDNRRENLRPATHAQNMANRGPLKTNTSGLKGVTFCKSSGRWAAFINEGGKRKRLGRFVTKEEAADAYRAAAQRLHGEFAATV